MASNHLSRFPAGSDGSVSHTLDSTSDEQPSKRLRVFSGYDDDDGCEAPPITDRQHIDKGQVDSDDEDDDDMFESVTHVHTEYLDDMSDDSMPELGTVELTVGDETASILAPKPRQVQVTARARAVRRHHHMVHLLCQVACARYLNYICCKPLLLARCLSLIPSFTVNRIAEHLVPGKQEIRREWASSDLHHFLSWYQSFRIRTRKPKGTAGLEGDFIRLVETRNATRPWHQPMLLASMLRALTFDARLCVGIAPPPLKLTRRESLLIELALDNCDGSSVAAAATASGSLPEAASSVGPTAFRPSSSEPASTQPLERGQSFALSVPEFWCEVFDQISERWVPINAYTGAIEHPSILGRPLGRQHCAFPYIIGLDSHNFVRDITRRYAQDFTNTILRLRLESVDQKVDRRAQVWWEHWISRWSNSDSEAGDKHERENEEMDKRSRPSAIPKRIADFAKNPYYVLQRNLRQNEIIHPAHPVVGVIKGEHVYLRENVRVLRSQQAWMREGRQVKAGQVAAKQIKHRGVTARSKRTAEAMEASGIEPTADLFGEWQTELFRPPPVHDGRVPRNEFGNVNLFTDSMLPEGAVHIPNANAKRLCKELGIDAADAVVGFDFRRGQSLPIIQGVVIPAEAFDLIADALREDRHVAEEKKLADLEQRALKYWRRLLVALRVRADVDASFARHSERPSGITFSSRDSKGKQPELEYNPPHHTDTEDNQRSESEPDPDPSDTTSVDTGGGFII
ncbi:hypothetical protein IW146_001252 [Coemansia sp. RSA 922]|nr:hypothetical protein H4S04_008385 [Coemansia sp. S16]KAJ2067280.1 hypothetical protein GGI08_001462 [Coemansia sp. S2]KAJ2116799.1 hypothetical protein IW146_001252 [Coemansia sp. RSA 922]